MRGRRVAPPSCVCWAGRCASCCSSGPGRAAGRQARGPSPGPRNRPARSSRACSGRPTPLPGRRARSSAPAATRRGSSWRPPGPSTFADNGGMPMPAPLPGAPKAGGTGGAQRTGSWALAEEAATVDYGRSAYGLRFDSPAAAAARADGPSAAFWRRTRACPSCAATSACRAAFLPRAHAARRGCSRARGRPSPHGGPRAGVGRGHQLAEPVGRRCRRSRTPSSSTACARRCQRPRSGRAAFGDARARGGTWSLCTAPRGRSRTSGPGGPRAVASERAGRGGAVAGGHQDDLDLRRPTRVERGRGTRAVDPAATRRDGLDGQAPPRTGRRSSSRLSAAQRQAW